MSWSYGPERYPTPVDVRTIEDYSDHAAVLNGLSADDVPYLLAGLYERRVFGDRVIAASLDELEAGWPLKASRVARAIADYDSAVRNRPSYAPGPTRTEHGRRAVAQNEMEELRLLALVLHLRRDGLPIPPAARTIASPERCRFYRSF